MRIVVVGGTGLIGSRVVAALQGRGHPVTAASRRTGVDSSTGAGLTEVLGGADVLVDATRPPGSADAAAVHDFFTTSTAHLLRAATAAEVGHLVTVTTVGANRPHAIPYYRAKAAQEDLVRAGGIPYTLLHATQFYEFVGTIADVSTHDQQVRLPGALSQPVAADDVGIAVADAAAAPPANDDVEVAGPQRFALDELARTVLAHRGDPRTVVRDDTAPYFGGPIEQDTLLPVAGAKVMSTTLTDWLGRQRS